MQLIPYRNSFIDHRGDKKGNKVMFHHKGENMKLIHYRIILVNHKGSKT